ncbi:MAG: L-fucose dehydrogenase [Saprospiraceae bacterium]|jgi:L-fucose dehydrogenase
MDLNLKGKVYIVSGGSKGIGEGISRAIVAEGGQVMIATRSTGAVTEALISELHSKDTNVQAVYGDLQEVSNCKNAISETIKKFGRIDGIVNNAGMNDGVGLEAGPEAFRKSIQINLYHYYDLVHYALPYLKESKGAIVNVSSKVALTGQGNTSGYAAAKGAQLALTREWAAELLPYSIRVNAVLPAEVMTPLYRKWLDNSFEDPASAEKEINSKIPFENRMTTKDEMAAMVVFLLSDKSSHTTGQFMSVDGGYTHLDRSLT